MTKQKVKREQVTHAVLTIHFASDMPIGELNRVMAKILEANKVYILDYGLEFEED
jgi:hypothetical protein